MEKKYAVPDGMLEAAMRASMDAGLGIGPSTELRVVIEAAIRWQSENPPVPSLLDISSNLKPEGQQIAINESIEWIRRMYLAPEPRHKDGEVEWVDNLPVGVWFKGKIVQTNIPHLEPEAPDEIKDLLVKEEVEYGVGKYGPGDMGNFTWEQSCEVNRRIREAFRRGKKSDAK